MLVIMESWLQSLVVESGVNSEYTLGSKERKSFSVKWNSAEYLKETFLPPTGENKKIIFIKKLDLYR